MYLRRGSSQKREERRELRPGWGMVNFSCSHRCLLTEVMVVRGAFGASNTGASRLLTTSFAWPSCSYSFPCPDPNISCAYTPRLWRSEPLSSSEAAHRQHFQQSVRGLPLDQSICVGSCDEPLTVSLLRKSSIFPCVEYYML